MHRRSRRCSCTESFAGLSSSTGPKAETSLDGLADVTGGGDTGGEDAGGEVEDGGDGWIGSSRWRWTDRSGWASLLVAMAARPWQGVGRIDSMALSSPEEEIIEDSGDGEGNGRAGIGRWQHSRAAQQDGTARSSTEGRHRQSSTTREGRSASQASVLEEMVDGGGGGAVDLDSDTVGGGCGGQWWHRPKIWRTGRFSWSIWARWKESWGDGVRDLWQGMDGRWRPAARNEDPAGWAVLTINLGGGSTGDGDG